MTNNDLFNFNTQEVLQSLTGEQQHLNQGYNTEEARSNTSELQQQHQQLLNHLLQQQSENQKMESNLPEGKNLQQLQQFVENRKGRSDLPR